MTEFCYTMVLYTGNSVCRNVKANCSTIYIVLAFSHNLDFAVVYCKTYFNLYLRLEERHLDDSE